jgi:uncharacterized membrane protein required for colicin V production
MNAFSLDTLPFNWFDVLIVVVLFLGLRRGRKRGMSEELISLLAWICIAVGCAIAYQPIGNLLADRSVFSLLSSYLMAYIAIAIMIGATFAVFKRIAGGKLLGSDVFGKSEFYLGMVAGMVRFCCILVTFLSLLNARLYTSQEVQAGQAYQNDVYGSNFFPTLYSIQAQVFEKSLTGPFIKNQLGFLLIKPTAPDDKQFKQKEFISPI